jgi:hypothetical protein
MIFVTGKDGSMFLMLSEKDIEIMRQGNTKFVDERQTGGIPFNRVVLSLHKTDEEAVAILKQAGHYVPNREDMRAASPRKNESLCKGCNGIIDNGSLMDGICIVCWRKMALGSQPVQDGQNRRATNGSDFH